MAESFGAPIRELTLIYVRFVDLSIASNSCQKLFLIANPSRSDENGLMFLINVADSSTAI